MSTGGSFVPQALIFFRNNMENELLDGAPAGTLGIVQESRWMTTEVFLKWLKHSQTYATASLEDKLILIMDDNASHERIHALNSAEENGSEMICHRIAPTDYNQSMCLFTDHSKHISIKKYQIV
ncbi:hypothetical protein JTB14_022574 [Gonioctena quinquepunctata]|nr:hypothetical protein JTB14_022574 [Gonioctena quinquepunctata]